MRILPYFIVVQMVLNIILLANAIIHKQAIEDLWYNIYKLIDELDDEGDNAPR